MSLYTPAHFAKADRAAGARLMHDYPFATLVTPATPEPLVSHLPLLLHAACEPHGTLIGHFARANPHWQQATGAESIAIFHGPHAYVSPGWYQGHPAVPTWNYAVVHAHGRARLMDEAELHDLVVRLSNTYEAPRAKPWKATELPAEFVGNLLKAIVGFEIEVERLEGKFKLSQNRPAEIPRVIEALELAGEGETASLMRGHPPASKG